MKNNIILFVFGLTIQAAYSSDWLTPDQMEEGNAKMRERSGIKEKARNTTPTMEEINAGIRARVVDEKGMEPSAVRGLSGRPVSDSERHLADCKAMYNHVGDLDKVVPTEDGTPGQKYIDSLANYARYSVAKREYENSCLTASERQPLEQRKAAAGGSAPVNKPLKSAFSTTPTIDSESSCRSDFECGMGNRCIKAPLKFSGTCMKSVDKYGTKTYEMPRSESVLPNLNVSGQCSFTLDCPIGFRCDTKYKVCVK